MDSKESDGNLMSGFLSALCEFFRKVVNPVKVIKFQEGEVFFEHHQNFIICVFFGSFDQYSEYRKTHEELAYPVQYIGYQKQIILQTHRAFIRYCQNHGITINSDVSQIDEERLKECLKASINIQDCEPNAIEILQFT